MSSVIAPYKREFNWVKKWNKITGMPSYDTESDINSCAPYSYISRVNTQSAFDKMTFWPVDVAPSIGPPEVVRKKVGHSRKSQKCRLHWRYLDDTTTPPQFFKLVRQWMELITSGLSIFRAKLSRALVVPKLILLLTAEGRDDQTYFINFEGQLSPNFHRSLIPWRKLWKVSKYLNLLLRLVRGLLPVLLRQRPSRRTRSPSSRTEGRSGTFLGRSSRGFPTCWSWNFKEESFSYESTMDQRLSILLSTFSPFFVAPCDISPRHKCHGFRLLSTLIVCHVH